MCSKFICLCFVAASLNNVEVNLYRILHQEEQKEKQSKYQRYRCMYCCFLNFAWSSFSIFGSSYMWKPCTFPVSASDLCIEGWRIVYQELVVSIFSVIRVKLSSNSYGGSFWSFCRSLFRKCWTTELSIHLFSVNTRLNALGAKNGLYMILRLRCWSNLSLNRVGQKVCSAKKPVQQRSPFWRW